MRGLICTHHFYAWGGSEIVALEIIEEFQRQGCTISVFIPCHDHNFLHAALDDDVDVVVDVLAVDLLKFDFVYSHHQIPSRFLLKQPKEFLFGQNRPVFIYNHLSPFEPFEFPGPFCEAELADIILCNSPETALKLSEFGLIYNNVELFPNPSPESFTATKMAATPGDLKRILVVSNHLPTELKEALEILGGKGIAISHIGVAGERRRLLPTDIFQADAVVTIGKTVQNALRARCPVFCYDWYAGPGWLNESNFEDAANTNFSGRSDSRKGTSKELVKEIESGYLNALTYAQEIPAVRLSKYSLEISVSKLLRKIEKIRQSKRCAINPELVSKFLIEAEIYGLVDREYTAKVAMQRPPLQTTGQPPDIYANCIKVQESNSQLEAKIVRQPEAGKAMVVAVFAFRYDAHLVPALLENISPFVHAWIAWDDRKVGDAFTGDANRRTVLFEAARDMGADWILAADPDERLEDGLAEKIDELTNEHGPVCWSFDCRELFEEMRYRVDGLWHDRPRVRLYPCLPGMHPDSQQLHSSWTKNESNFPTKKSKLCFYHLRMITPERRHHRRELYAAADSTRKFQAIGYDYIDDERGMELEQVLPDRKYSPSHQEDNGLWAPQISAIGKPITDPCRVQISRLVETVYKGGAANAAFLAMDLSSSSGQDTDFGLMAAELCLRSGNTVRGANLCEEISCRHPDMLLPKSLLSRFRQELGDCETSHRVACSAANDAPDSALLNQQVQRSLDVQGRFETPDALWRRWAKKASLHNGQHIAEADMAVVVIGYRSPPEIAAAVASLRWQNEQVEIVVVNSSGGDIAKLLADHLDHIRLIEVEERLFVGAARNIGIDASVAPHVAFLASDCTAESDWVRNRMVRHRSGAGAVACAVVPEQPNNLASLAAHFLMHRYRRPQPEADIIHRYGVSCARRVLESCGYFPTGLRLGEDSWYNAILRNTVGIAWAPDVISTHRYPTNEKSLIADMRIRGRRRAQYPPFSNFDSHESLSNFLEKWSAESIEDSISKLQKESILDPDQLVTVSQLIKDASLADVAGVKEGWKDVLQAKMLMQDIESNNCSNPEETFEQVIKLWPQNAILRIKLADHVLQKAASEDNYLTALTLCREAASLAPGNGESVAKICTFLEAEGKVADALKEAEHACLMYPTQVTYWWRLNGVASKLGLTSIQLYALQKILTLVPSSHAVHSALAGFHQRSGDQALAERRGEMTDMLV